jgi:stage V sporulation protein R
MPVMYNHWSFGKTFLENEQDYKKGRSGLAYEVVINTNPSIAYCMENNTATMQALVMAHASVGHSSFFKTNYLFRDWSDADSIIDYLKFARSYISQCEQKYGFERVELLLDACHSLQLHGVDKYKKPSHKKDHAVNKKKARHSHEEQAFADLWRTVPQGREEPPTLEEEYIREENILYFIEKNSPVLESWEREIVRIVRKIAQYFYPQRQTQLMNEGWASFVHYTIMNMMYDQGLIGAGSVIEFLQSHAGVVAQRDWDQKGYGGINVYALGFAMMQDIKRICEAPDEEDLKLFPNIANTDWLTTLKYIVANYRDESFVMQFLSPKVVKQFKLFSIDIDEEVNFYSVSHVQDESHLQQIREVLSAQYDLSKRVPHLEISSVNWKTDRTLHIDYYEHNDVWLESDSGWKTASYIERLWGHQVNINSVDINGEDL